jgi:hypothetical protein
MGILSVAISPRNDMVIVGCGDGNIAALKLPKLNIAKYYFNYTGKISL